MGAFWPISYTFLALSGGLRMICIFAVPMVDFGPFGPISGDFRLDLAAFGPISENPRADFRPFDNRV